MSDSEGENLFGNVKETINNLQFNKIHEKILKEFEKEESDDCIISSETPGAFTPMIEPDDSVIIVENTTKKCNNVTSKRSRRFTRSKNVGDGDISDEPCDPDYKLPSPERSKRRPAKRARKTKTDDQNQLVTRPSLGVNNQTKRRRGRQGLPVSEQSMDIAANSSGPGEQSTLVQFTNASTSRGSGVNNPAKRARGVHSQPVLEESLDTAANLVPGEQSILDQFINSFTSRGRRVNNQVKRVRGKRSQPVPEESLHTAANSAGLGEHTILDQFINSLTSRGRGRTSRGRTRQSPRVRRNVARAARQSIPDYIYSVGNTDEYPDELENVPLFHAKPTNEVSTVDVTENEELSVTVQWRCSKIVKFKIRKFQKFTELYKFFASKDDVDESNLLFVYNNQILKPNDTPDSIKYSEVKLIEGGIVKKTSNIDIKREKSPVLIENGINLKFQCQNSKKPFLISVTEDEKLSIAMMKCAEFFELQSDQLRFEFDGDIVSGKQTAKDLELEGGECIDVKVIK